MIGQRLHGAGLVFCEAEALSQNQVGFSAQQDLRRGVLFAQQGNGVEGVFDLDHGLCVGVAGVDYLVAQAQHQHHLGHLHVEADHPLGDLSKSEGAAAVFDCDGALRSAGLRRGLRGSGTLGGLSAAGGQAEHQGQGKDQGYQFFHVSYSFESL